MQKRSVEWQSPFQIGYFRKSFVKDVFTVTNHCDESRSGQGCHLVFLKAKSAKFVCFKTACQKWNGLAISLPSIILLIRPFWNYIRPNLAFLFFSNMAILVQGQKRGGSFLQKKNSFLGKHWQQSTKEDGRGRRRRHPAMIKWNVCNIFFIRKWRLKVSYDPLFFSLFCFDLINSAKMNYLKWTYNVLISTLKLQFICYDIFKV